MPENTKNIIDIDENLRLLGTAHVSTTSVNLVKNQIAEYNPDIIAVELCESRLASLKTPEGIDNEDLLKIISDGKSAMIILQSALSVQQRKMGIDAGEKPGAELLAAINIAEEGNIPVELIDRDVIITLRRAWHKMGLREKIRALDALLGEDEGDDFDLEELLEDSDLLSNMMEEVYKIAPNAGYVLIDERDAFLSARIQQIRSKGKILAVVGAGHLSGIQENLKKPAMESISRLSKLNEQPKKPNWPKYLMLAIPIFLAAAIGRSAYNGDFATVWDSVSIWLVLNATLTGLGVIIARGHPLSIIVGALASPITSLNPSLAAGWFAGYTQLKMAPPTGKDASDFLEFPSFFSMFFRNKVGRVIMVTALGNLGSTAGTFLAAGMISFGWF
ncbi:MAG: TraB/GumN family protein [Candidatus Poseidoniales archaeon]|jgi:pheromone shutdown-related protein TraB|nr:TraB/GumN family protein [Candidatus Poseidoniales archaeon]|tara:strand:- start:12007 stop:13173 length:1167 start_codon:yes stop_codon:yes gene_type:complete